MSEYKVFALGDGPTDWVVAKSQAEALSFYRSEFELDDEDMPDNVRELDQKAVDEMKLYDEDAGEEWVMRDAIMDSLTKKRPPFLVASTEI